MSDPEDIIASWQSFLETFQENNQRMADSFFQNMNKHMLPPTLFGDAFIKAGQALLKNPAHMLNAQTELLKEMNELWQRMGSTEKAASSSTDKRFTHEAWDTMPYFLFLKEYYLITARWLQNLVTNIEGIDENTSQKIQFYTSQLINAVSPTNFPFTNPEVLENIVKTKGACLTKGIENLIEDMEMGKWMKMTDPSAFELGHSIATTKGSVIYRNELFELIHYEPLTTKQFKVPLLIIPPWINKFYIFDLSANNSFVKWKLEQGHNVFIISWVNPGPDHALKSFDDYLLDGAYKACETIAALTNSRSINTIGYCVGGNLLAALSAYIAKIPAPFSLQSMTLLATITDFSKVGDLKFFMDEEYLQYMEETMTQKGFLDGNTLKSMFSMLRPNELVWSFFIKNYLLGQIPPAFDFLYWNSDSPRLPANLHRFVIQKCFQENQFMQKGGLSINNVPIDLRDITTPTCLVATQEDHISPWQSCFPAAHLIKGPVQFLLAGSGHVAGIINHPARNKYHYYTNPNHYLPANDWYNVSTKNEGSWWTYWNSWINGLSGEKNDLPPAFPAIEPAPGSYVRQQFQI